MKILELFCGRGGWSKPFIAAGYDCTGIDIKDFGYPGKFIKADALDWEPEEKYDIVLASPPCSEFSEVKRNTATHPYDERIGLDLVYRTFYLIEQIKPKFWVIENVKGLTEFIGKEREKVRYGKARKTAYLWGNFKPLGMITGNWNYDGSMWHAWRKGGISGWELNKLGLRGEIPKPLAKRMMEVMT